MDWLCLRDLAMLSATLSYDARRDLAMLEGAGEALR